LDRVGDLRSRRELAGDGGDDCDTAIDAPGVAAVGDGEGEVLRRSAGDVRELLRPPDLPGTAAAG
ncbi:MAG: hypothetical protein ACRDZ0_12900, partial [Acidimicrobiales bacterium]